MQYLRTTSKALDDCLREIMNDGLDSTRRGSKEGCKSLFTLGEINMALA